MTLPKPKPLTRREQDDLLDKTILEMVSKGHIHWSDLMKRVMATCHDWSTPGRFNARIQYLLKKKYIERVSRGIYKLTINGEKYKQII